MYSIPEIILYFLMVKFKELKKSSIQLNGKKECSRECHEAIWLPALFLSITQLTVMLVYSNGHCNTHNFGRKLHVFKPSDYLVPLYGKVHRVYKVFDTMATKTFLFFTQFAVMLRYSNGHWNTEKFWTKPHVFKPRDHLVPLCGKV